MKSKKQTTQKLINMVIIKDIAYIYIEYFKQSCLSVDGLRIYLRNAAIKQ